MAGLAANNISDGYLRAFCWRGSEMMAISAQQTKTHVAIAAWEWPSYFDPETKMRGITLEIAKWKRPSPASAPAHAKAAGLYKPVLVNDGVASFSGHLPIGIDGKMTH